MDSRAVEHVVSWQKCLKSPVSFKLKLSPKRNRGFFCECI